MKEFISQSGDLADWSHSKTSSAVTGRWFKMHSGHCRGEANLNGCTNYAHQVRVVVNHSPNDKCFLCPYCLWVARIYAAKRRSTGKVTCFTLRRPNRSLSVVPSLLVLTWSKWLSFLWQSESRGVSWTWLRDIRVSNLKAAIKDAAAENNLEMEVQTSSGNVHICIPLFKGAICKTFSWKHLEKSSKILKETWKVAVLTLWQWNIVLQRYLLELACKPSSASLCGKAPVLVV